jgi:hypothetical protein
MRLARRDVIRKQNEALAHLQERNALGRVARLFWRHPRSRLPCSVLAPRGHFSVSAVTKVTQNVKSRFHG